MDSSASYLVCPKCKQRLDHAANLYSCSSCERSYPIIMDCVAALFDAPDRIIANAYLQLHNRIRQWRIQSNNLAETLKSSKRKKVLLPMLKAHNDNRAIFESWASRLEQHIKPAVLLDLKAGNQIAGYGYNFNYLMRDWSNQRSSRLEVQNILNGLKRCLRLTGVRGRTSVMGMGTGRLGLELTEYFEDIWGVDASFGQLVQYHDLLQRDAVFWQVNSRNQIDHNGMVKKISASIPRRLKKAAEKVHYIWADALNSPFGENFFDWVISIYFSDVRPLPDLIKEVKRILRPGGFFLHYGPLEYHFKDIEHHYAFDEFKACFIENGFEIVHESTSTPPLSPDNKTSLTMTKQYIDKILLLRLSDGLSCK